MVRYKLIRTRRRTIGVAVENGEVVVRAPLSLGREEIEFFLEKHRDWIEKHLSDQDLLQDRFASVRAFQTLLVQGKEKTLVLGASRVCETDDAVYLKKLSEVRSFMCKYYEPLLGDCTAHYAKAVGAMPEDLSVRDFKARWGSCDNGKRIKLNWRLSFLPVSLRDYVIVHELCHLLYMDHSSAFWKEVGRVLPDYRARRRALKDYSFLTLLYR